MADHVAIMNSRAGLISKILSGEKRIESRWYRSKFAPWNRIAVGDRVFFKDSGKPVTAVARVSRVVQFEITPQCLREALDKYGEDIAFAWPLDEVYEWALKKQYCVLVFIEGARRVEPFVIDKTGFGNACAWMCVGNIERVRVSQSV